MRALGGRPNRAFVVHGAVVLGPTEALGATERIRRDPGPPEPAHNALFAGRVREVLARKCSREP